MSILAIETATTVCAAAVVRNGQVLGEAFLNEKYIHAEKLMVQVDSVLSQSGCSMADLDGIAISIGPGSFTGLRIGLSVAKGLVFASGKPLVAVPTLEALAQRLVDERVAVQNDRILAALDARRDEVYCQWFRVEGSTVQSLGAARDLSVMNVLDESPSGKVFITGDALAKLRKAICNGRQEIQWAVVPDDVARCSAGTVGRIGELMLRRGELADVVTLEPKYIKEFFFRQQL